jgi:hypothetical protein
LVARRQRSRGPALPRPLTRGGGWSRLCGLRNRGSTLTSWRSGRMARGRRGRRAGGCYRVGCRRRSERMMLAWGGLLSGVGLWRQDRFGSSTATSQRAHRRGHQHAEDGLGDESRRASVNRRASVIGGEFDPGSGSTLAACLMHASRARTPSGVLRGGRVRNTWATCPGVGDSRGKPRVIPHTLRLQPGGARKTRHASPLEGPAAD